MKAQKNSLRLNITRFSAIFYILINCFIPHIQGDACGGLLESDAGEFELPDGASSGDYECIWIIQLLSRQNISFTINRLDNSSSSIVSLYPEHEASETVLTPIRLTASAVGQTIQTKGQTLIIILARSFFSTGLSFSWDSTSSVNREVLTAANYVDTGSGKVRWNRFSQRERLTWALNLESAQSLTLKSETEFTRCELLNPCWCSYFGLYEITNDGYLVEVTRVCGRSSTFETEKLYPKLLAFVYINSTTAESLAENDHVEISWFNTKSVEPTSPTTEEAVTWPSTEITTADYPDSSTIGYPGLIQLDCGGLINLPENGSSILVGYKHNQEYNNNENCFWTLENLDFSFRGRGYFKDVNITLISDGFEQGQDALYAFTVDDYRMYPTLLESNKTASFYWYGLSLSFTSDALVPGAGFIVRIDVIDEHYTGLWAGEQWAHTNLNGRQSFGWPYRSRDRSVIAINSGGGESAITFGVEVADIRGSGSSCYDGLDVYEVGRLGNSTRKYEICGKSDTLTGVFTTQGTIFAHFISNSMNPVDGGFVLSWNSTDEHSTSARYE